MSQLHPLRQYTSRRHRSLRSFIRKTIARPLITTILSTSIEGEESVAGMENAYIVVGNHSSHLDAPMMFTLLPEHMTERLATGAAADYFYRRRFISRLTALFFNTYPIERKGKVKKVTGKGLEMKEGPSPAAGMTGRLLKAGVPILIFPEGTRSRDGRMGEFKAGAAALSQKLSVPIVPVALIGGHDAMPVGAIWPKLGRPRVKLVLGSPMTALPGETVEHYNARIRACVFTMRATGHPHTGEGVDLDAA